jgi:hypothetical protein
MYHFGNEKHYKNANIVEEGLGTYVKSKVKKVIDDKVGTRLREFDKKINRKVSGLASKFSRKESKSILVLQRFILSALIKE